MDGGFLKGKPQSKIDDVVFLRENPKIKWMMIWGTPILGNPQMVMLEKGE